MKNSKLILLGALSAAVLAACGGGSNSDDSASSTPEAAELDVSPTTVDDAATVSTEAHVVLTPAAGSTVANKLFVFLPGTDGTPTQYRLVLRSGASRGFHAIGLNYQNGPIPVGVVCAASADADCFWNVRREILTGQDLSANVNVSPSNAVLVRLPKLLTYLNRIYPNAGWGQYLSNGEVVWSKVVVGGHSQGGGHAGVMTKLFAMSRACYFSSPPDWNGNANAPAPWEGYANITPAARQFGLAGLSDPSVPYDQLSAIWRTLGLAAFGAPVSIDSTAAPYNDSHRLTTNRAPAASNDAGTPLHGLTVRDAFTPKTSDGAPVFDPAWGYMCFQ